MLPMRVSPVKTCRPPREMELRTSPLARVAFVNADAESTAPARKNGRRPSPAADTAGSPLRCPASSCRCRWCIRRAIRARRGRAPAPALARSISRRAVCPPLRPPPPLFLARRLEKDLRAVGVVDAIVGRGAEIRLLHPRGLASQIGHASRPDFLALDGSTERHVSDLQPGEVSGSIAASAPFTSPVSSSCDRLVMPAGVKSSTCPSPSPRPMRVSCEADVKRQIFTMSRNRLHR